MDYKLIYRQYKIDKVLNRESKYDSLFNYIKENILNLNEYHSNGKIFYGKAKNDIYIESYKTVNNTTSYILDHNKLWLGFIKEFQIFHIALSSNMIDKFIDIIIKHHFKHSKNIFVYSDNLSAYDIVVID